MIVWTSLKVSQPGDPDFLTSAFSLANYVRAFGTATPSSSSGKATFSAAVSPGSRL